MLYFLCLKFTPKSCVRGMLLGWHIISGKFFNMFYVIRTRIEFVKMANALHFLGIFQGLFLIIEFNITLICGREIGLKQEKLIRSFHTHQSIVLAISTNVTLSAVPRKGINSMETLNKLLFPFVPQQIPTAICSFIIIFPGVHCSRALAPDY